MVKTKTLIINIGPLGDVVRTTVLLNVIDGEIYWLTTKKCESVLKSKKIAKVFYIEDKNDWKKYDFDLVISLNEEDEAIKALKSIKYKRLTGVVGKNKYTDESSQWFDMSLSSRLGKPKADFLKYNNRLTYQEMLLDMLTLKFKGEEYDIGVEGKKVNEPIVGIIRDIKGNWPNKGWALYDRLANALKHDGFKVKFLDMKPTFKEHIDEINSCRIIVCGDTAGMHVALALKKNVVALFNCTSPWEIYGYGRMEKVVSSKLSKYFYKRTSDYEARNAIGFFEVYTPIKEML